MTDPFATGAVVEDDDTADAEDEAQDDDTGDTPASEKPNDDNN